MATPKEALTGISQTININSNAKASPKNQPIGNSDTVTFKNNDPNNTATVTFLGAGADEFSYNGSTVSSVTVTAGGTAGPLTPNNSNLTVDYQVSIAPQQGGPFSIEVGSGPLQIARHKQGRFTLLLQIKGEFGRRGRLACAMQPDHHDTSRLVQIERFVIAAQQLRELVIKDFYDLLPWGNRTQDFLTQRLTLYLGDEVFGDLKMYVGFQQSQANLPQSVVNVCLRDGAMTPKVLEDVLELIREL